jgi:ABC-type nitrate/sulfonate/bicarbonate transport system substrate-binding protein
MKQLLRPAARGAHAHASSETDRAATSPDPAVAAIDRSPIQVDRGPIPTATGIAHRLGWLEREAALDGTPLTVGGGRSEAPLRASLLRAAAPPDHLYEGESTGALWERSEARATRLIGLTWVESFQAVVALPDAGIAEPGQLAGRRLALPATAARGSTCTAPPRAAVCTRRSRSRGSSPAKSRTSRSTPRRRPAIPTPPSSRR